MTVTGNAPPPYHLQGLRHCLERIRAAADAGRIICHERGWGMIGTGLGHIETIRARLQEAFDHGETDGRNTDNS